MFGPPFGVPPELEAFAIGAINGMEAMPMDPRGLAPMGGVPFPAQGMPFGAVLLDGPFPIPMMHPRFDHPMAAPRGMTPPQMRMPQQGGWPPDMAGRSPMEPPGMGGRQPRGRHKRRSPPPMGMGMPGMGQPPLHPMAAPGMRDPRRMQGLQDPFPAPRHQRVLQAGAPFAGNVFDPSRLQRDQPDHQPREHGRHREKPRARYERVKSLTPGGMSESITIVRNRANGKLFVEKKVRTDGPRGKRVNAELEALKAVRSHPNLNHMIEYDAKGDGVCSIILEYCDGGSLDQRIADMASKGPGFSEAAVWHVLLSVAKALAFLHTGIKDVQRDQPDPDWNTIAHLDLKPQNIFLSSERKENGQRRIILADFGCAVTFNDIKNRKENERAQPCGTPGWYPPEGLVGGGYGTRTDIWMLGATIQVTCLLTSAPHRPALASAKPCGMRFTPELQGMVKDLTNDRFDRRPSAREIARVAAQELKQHQRI